MKSGPTGCLESISHQDTCTVEICSSAVCKKCEEEGEVGDIVKHSQNIWQWWHDPENGVFVKQHNDTGSWTLYEKSTVLSELSCGDRFVTRETIYPIPNMNICSVQEFGNSSVQSALYLSPSPAISAPDNFFAVLKEKGCTWLWDKMCMTNSIGQGMNLEAADRE